MIVLDASVALSWVLADESTPEAEEAMRQAARRRKLSAYDAAYLALAGRLRLPLATLDNRLQSAASAEGVPLVTD